MDQKNSIDMNLEEEGERVHIVSNNGNNNVEQTQNLRELTTVGLIDEFLANPTNLRLNPILIDSSYNEDDTVLTFAIRSQNLDAVISLLEARADPNKKNIKGVTPASIASHKGNPMILHALIEAGANVNAVNESGSTALIQASHFGNVPAVHMLLKYNASADFANSKGTTALMRASQEGHVAISKLLIENNADVNRKNLEGMNALMLASQRGHADMVQLLIKCGALMDEQTSQGSTALMLACKRGHAKCVEVLVSMGAEIYIRDARLRTARDTATRRHHLPLLQYLGTQVQIKFMQNIKMNQRTQQLLELKKLFDLKKVSLRSTEVQLVNVLDSLQNVSTNATISVTSSSIITTPRKDYPDWQWSKLLLRCLSLPLGIFDLIIEFLPSPRIWSLQLFRLRKRCRLAPLVSIHDTSILMDEILCDANIFKMPKQKNLLMAINQNSSLRQVLMERFEMSEGLIDLLCSWSDIQSLISRTTEMEVSFKSKLARSMLSAANQLYKWHCMRNFTTKRLDYMMMYNRNQSSISPFSKALNLIDSKLLSSENTDGNDIDYMEATDIGNEEGSDSDNFDQDIEDETNGQNIPMDDDESDIDPNEAHEPIAILDIGYVYPS